MKYLNLSKPLAVLAMTALVLLSCTKVDVQGSIGDAGQTLVKILNGGPTTAATVVNNPIDFVNAPVTLLGADIRRDIPNNSELQQVMNITVKDDQALVAATVPGDLIMPEAWYTVGSATPKTGGAGGTYKIVLQPGEFAKQIYITVPNATLLDPSLKYALGFTITAADANGKISVNKSIVIEIGAKNAYDGLYEDTWTNYHPTSNPGYTGDKTNIELRTTGANKCKMWFNAAGAYGNPAILGGSLGYFGAQEPEYTVNTATNQVTVQNVAAGAVTFYTMAVGFNSRYDPAVKTFYVKYGYSYAVPGVWDAGCREWTIQLKYLGPR
jgi:hypothetical protein